MKRRLREWLPTRESLLQKPALSSIAHLLGDENLWHLNRRSVSMGGAIGVFWGFMPILGQMPLAALSALLLRGNVPLSLATTWISNPITAPAVFFGCYELGLWILGNAAHTDGYQFTVDWFLSNLAPVGVGCLAAGTTAAVATHLVLRQLWKADIRRRWANRKARKRPKRDSVD